MNRQEIGLISASILLAMGIRLFLIFTYQPLYGNDSPSYAALAEMIRTGDFTGYDGRRTPGYPLFMLMLNYNNHWIRLAQNMAGCLSLLSIYLLARRFLPAIASAVLLFFLALSIQFPFYEAIIQTEALAGFAIIASLYCFVVPGRHPVGRLLTASAIASLGVLVRPHLVIIPPLYGVLYLFRPHANRRLLLRGLVAIALPAAILVGGWVGFNDIKLSRPTFTTLPRGDMMAHMIPYVNDADEKYGAVKDAFVEAYAAMKDAVLAADDNRSGYMSFAYARIKATGGGSSLETSDIVHDMALDLIRKHPLGYVKNALGAWVRFWRVHIIVYPECFTGRPRWYDLSMAVWMPVKLGWLAANGLFFLFIPIWPFLPMNAERRFLLSTLYALALTASVSQALTQYYDSARFAVPFQPLVALAVALVAASMFEHWGRRAHPPASGNRENCA